MKNILLLFILSTLPTAMMGANCDLSHYHWNCDIPMHIKPSRSTHSLVYCGNTYGYITRSQYQQLARYQRADVNMILTVKGEYVDSPCIPDRR